MLAQARATIGRMLGAEDYDRFFDEIVGTRPLFVPDRDGHRRSLFPDDVRRTILETHAENAHRITQHGANPSGPPPAARRVGNADEFGRLIGEFHSRGYTVRVPEVGGLFEALATFRRALEATLLVAVEAELFWSAEGLEAPVHFDNSDIIAIQLVGEKLWFVSDETPSLPNNWKRIGEPAPQLVRPQRIGMAPGDLLYLPRGTVHTVHSTSESLHLSIGFTPLTLRDAIAAALDRLADLYRPLRAGVTARADDIAHGRHADRIAQAVRDGVEALASACRSPEFVEEAIDHRNSRFVGKLPALAKRDPPSSLAPETRVRRSDLAFAKLVATENVVDFSQPGGHILVHRGAEESLRFLAETEGFRVGDIPGAVTDDVRVALVRRFIGSGYLDPVGGS